LANSGTLASFITYPRYEWIDAGTAFFTEFMGTAILAVAVLVLGDDTNTPPGAGILCSVSLSPLFLWHLGITPEQR
jgi:aquaglyceroporin related protein